MDVHSTLVGKIAGSGDFTDDEKLVVMLALSSVDGRKFVRAAMQVMPSRSAAMLARKWAEQQGWQA